MLPFAQTYMRESAQWHNDSYLKALKEAVADGTLARSKNSYKLGVNVVETGTANNAAKKHALHDCTEPYADKKQNKESTKNVASKIPSTTEAGEDEFNHDDHYMKLLLDGFPSSGAVSPCHNYYVSRNKDTYRSIADTIGLDDWTQLVRS